MKRMIILSFLLICFGLIIVGCSNEHSDLPQENTESVTNELSAESDEEGVTIGASESETTGTGESSSESETEPADEDPVALRFWVMSDTHIGDPNLKDNMNIALEKAKVLSGGLLDMVLFAGDLTNSTGKNPSSDSEILQFRNQYLRAMRDIPMVYCLGSTHDLPSGNASPKGARELYYRTFGDQFFIHDKEADMYVSRGVRHAEIEGYHIFAIDHNASDAGLSWLETELQKASGEEHDKPIFAILHDPESEDVTSILNRYPQVICFTGHLHNSLAREDSISQDGGCTMVHCGGTAYYRVDGYTRESVDPYLALGERYNFVHNLYVEVDREGQVTMTRVDAYNDALIGEPWVVSPDRRDVYTNDRADTVERCTFPDDATLVVSEQGSTVTVSFDAANAGGAGSPMYYSIEVYQKKANGKYGMIQLADLGSQQVFYPNDVDIPKGHYCHTFTDVTVEDYAIVVKAYDCWNASVNALVYSNGTYTFDGVVGGKSELVSSDSKLGKD